MRVIRPEPVAGLDLGHGGADELAADALPDERGVDSPSVAISRPIPVVTVEVEGLHSVNITSFTAMSQLTQGGRPVASAGRALRGRSRTPADRSVRSPATPVSALAVKPVLGA